MSTKQSSELPCLVVSTDAGTKIWHKVLLAPKQSICYEGGDWVYKAADIDPTDSATALMKTAWESEKKFRHDTEATAVPGRKTAMTKTQTQAWKSKDRSTCYPLHALQDPEFTLWPGVAPPKPLFAPFAIGTDNDGSVMSQSKKGEKQPITHHYSKAPTPMTFIHYDPSLS